MNILRGVVDNMPKKIQNKFVEVGLGISNNNDDMKEYMIKKCFKF